MAYNYNIDKYDVTVGQYTDFLNSVAATDTYGLYNTSMATDLNIAGISRSGSSGSYTYSVIGSSANLPITYVSWGDAARFANWLQNGQPSGAEGPGTTETGAYTLNGAITERSAQCRHAQRRRDDLHSQRKRMVQGGLLQSRYQFVLPISVFQQHGADFGDAGQHAQHRKLLRRTTGLAVTGSTSYSSSQNYLTDVGAYTGIGQPLRRVRHGRQRVSMERSA